jgi:CBS-domain-containing membrane protein
MNIGEVMREDVVALRSDEAIDAAWRRMRDQQLAALPVADTVGRLIGVLSEHDLLARLAPRRESRWWMAIVYEEGRLAAEYVKSVAR